MDFYSEFSKYYDTVFPTGKAQLNFILEEALEGENNILDIACGTGNYAIALSEEGHRVSAIDFDEEMVKMADEKAALKNVKIDTYVGDMRKLNQYFQNEEFDVAFCIGNSLVHLIDLDDMQQALNQMYKLVKDNGKVILQIINYDRILKDRIDSLPTIEDKEVGVKFIRNYLYEDKSHLIYFNTELIVSTEGQKISYTNSVPLYPLKSLQLVDMLNIAGFRNIDLYGSFKKDSYNENSYATVIVAKK